MATLVAAARRTTSTTTVASILTPLVTLLLAEIRIARGTRGGCGRRAHCQAREGRLVASMRVLIGRVHRDTELLLGQLGELEGIDLGRNASYRTTALHCGGKPLDLSQLLGLQQAHIHILLVCSCNLLLLLLK